MSQPEASTRGAVYALISSGRHPVSGRPGRAREDARAVEMGLALAGGALHLVHAGDAEDTSLRDYLGMFHGLEQTDGLAAAEGELSLLPMNDGEDALPLLAAWLTEGNARLILTGQRAECGEGSGLLPYLLAERLGWAMVTGIAAIERYDEDRVTVLQALPQGQRRRLEVRLPCLIAVDAVAPAPRQSAFGPARRGRIRIVETAMPERDTAQAEWQWQPARARPRRLKVIKADNARDRFRAAAAKSSAAKGQVLSDLTPEQAADKLIAYLRAEKILADDGESVSADR